MTKDEQARQQFEQKAQEWVRQQQEEQTRIQGELLRAQQRAQLSQHELNNSPRRRYAAIVAIDLRGGFSKDGQIPWHYPADFKWFQSKTKGHVCVMGRTTYDDINKRLGDKAAESVLPNRTCFVVTSRPLERNNATSIASLTELDFKLDKMDIPYDKTVFFCGGERVYTESLSKCDTVYLTVVNKDVDCDKFFPITAFDRLGFQVKSTEQEQSEPDLRFVTYGRV